MPPRREGGIAMDPRRLGGHEEVVVANFSTDIAKTEAAVERWAERISPHLTAIAENIIQAGRELILAKEELPHGDFLDLVESLGLRPRTAQKFMAIARHELLGNASPGTQLPTSWTVLYELSRAPGELLEQAFADGEVASDMSRKDAVQLVARLQIEARTAEADTIEARIRRAQWEIGGIAAGFMYAGGDIACAAQMVGHVPPVWEYLGCEGPIDWLEDCVALVALFPRPDFTQPWDKQREPTR